MRSNFILLAFVVTANTVNAQSAPSTTDPVVASLRNEWQMLAGWISKAAEQMPEADYAFQPTPAVRTFGQLIGHLAGSQNLICSNALSETPKAGEDAIEKNVKTKAELVAAFRASTEFCMRAYSQPDAALSEATTLFGSASTRLAALARNTVHDGEHYGNIVTYMRIKGMVPPSSQPRTNP
jgi:uncharacterized damage-inducible protein DinB